MATKLCQLVESCEEAIHQAKEYEEYFARQGHEDPDPTLSPLWLAYGLFCSLPREDVKLLIDSLQDLLQKNEEIE